MAKRGPKTQEGFERAREGTRSFWNSLTPEQRDARIRHMVEGRVNKSAKVREYLEKTGFQAQ